MSHRCVVEGVSVDLIGGREDAGGTVDVVGLHPTLAANNSVVSALQLRGSSRSRTGGETAVKGQGKAVHGQ